MKISVKNRIILISAFITSAIISICIIIDINKAFPIALLFTLVCVNIIPFKIIKWYNYDKSLKSNFVMALILNSAIFAPVIVSIIISQGYSITLMLMLIFVISIISIFSSFLNTKFPKKTTEDDDIPIYDTPDILLQPKGERLANEKNRNYLPINTSYSKSIVIQILVWLLIALLVIIPFSKFLGDYVWGFWH